MIRFSEVVLAGHPDKFCDAVADAVLAACYEADPEAYCQVEVSAWSDQVWMSGGIVTRAPLTRSLREIVVAAGRNIGYTQGNWIDAGRYNVVSTICQMVDDPTRWTTRVNDQAICIGWAGCDDRTGFLPPEHFLAHWFRSALEAAFRGGPLASEGPDGKILVRMREEGDAWVLEHVLATAQQREQTAFVDFAAGVGEVLMAAYERLRERDHRWRSGWEDVQLMLNPNGPLLNGGSDGDNGQTGRKLVMDFYGPRVPIGGGALSGKDFSHIDRCGAIAARAAAIGAVRSGAAECKVILAYAPNVSEPLEIVFEMEGRGLKPPKAWFSHPSIVEHAKSTAFKMQRDRWPYFFAESLFD